jgi:hypothetical protein
MKKFLLYTTLTILIIGGLLGYLLYTEGAFDKPIPKTEKKLEPFMKCEAGKCATGKCGEN